MRALVFAGVSGNFIGVERNAGSGGNAMRAHAEAGDVILFDDIGVSRGRAFCPRAQVDAAAQEVRLIGSVAAGGRVVRAVREVEPPQTVPRDPVARTDHEDSAK